MKLSTFLLSTIVLASVSIADDMLIKQEGIKYIKTLGGALKSELKRRMKSDSSGMEALAFCTSSAEKITNEVNSRLPEHAKVRRTALNVRNNKINTADATDKKVMEAFVADIKENKLDSKSIKIVKEGNVTRLYKPLVTGKSCLKCHGSTLDPKIKDALKSVYPQDKAIGFKEGSLRGVIVAEIKKH